MLMGAPQCEPRSAPAAGGALALTPPHPLPSLPGQRCQDLLVQLYLQRPELRVHAPEALLRSMGATASSICKVSWHPLPWSVASEVGARMGHGHASSDLKARREPGMRRVVSGRPVSATAWRPVGAAFLPRSPRCGAETRVFLRPRPSSVRGAGPGRVVRVVRFDVCRHPGCPLPALSPALSLRLSCVFCRQTPCALQAGSCRSV